MHTVGRERARENQRAHSCVVVYMFVNGREIERARVQDRTGQGGIERERESAGGRKGETKCVCERERTRERKSEKERRATEREGER